MEKKITAPKMVALEYRNLSIGQKCTLNNESAALLNTLIEKLSKFQWNGETERWKFWVSVLRGDIEDFDYADLHERDEYETDEEFEKAWKEWFPKEEYWYEITIAADNGYAVIVINNSIVLNVEPNTKSLMERDYAEFLQFLIDEVDSITAHVEEGTYYEYIKNGIPAEYRMGTISRDILWNICQRYISLNVKDLEQGEIDFFVESGEQKDATADKVGRMTDMTAQKYYNACAVCYEAAEFEGAEGKTAKEQYIRFADNRDGGLSTIDDESVDAFNTWYGLSYSEKWEIENASHQWEISVGSTHTRIHLCVEKDEQGYYLSLSGGLHCRTAEVVRMYNSLIRNGYPVRLYGHQKIADALMGLDDVGIVPISDTPSQYWYGGFPQSDVISFINLSEEVFTEDEIKQIIEKATWLDMPLLTIKAG
ncbi:hypothetical protein [Bacteroides acidifaciens]|uniref:hypothetical protein n=1 Tax=Bacteroides acidifaciens TaxID=85831 RepID=UPI0025B56740|nr:hypothetical protein [Bacteroides acidifaciens]